MTDDPNRELEELIATCIECMEEGDDQEVERRLKEAPRFEQAARKALLALRESGLVGASGPEFGVPEQVRDYRLLRRLGQGGMGIAYLARHERLQRLACLKWLHPTIASDVVANERFEREARAIARLEHPHIVKIFEAGEVGGQPFLAMEYLAGQSLEHRLREAPLPPLAESLPWMRDIADALHQAHQSGIVHRDVKPSNILLDPVRGAVLVDFGLARDDARSRLTRTGDFQGSPHYAAPEQIDATIGTTGPNSDIYSLGVTLFECVTLKLPFEGSSTEQIFRSVLDGASRPLRALEPSLPRDLETIVQKAMERDPARRYRSAEAMRDDLDALLHLRPIQARRPSLPRRVVLWSKRHRASALSVMLGVLLVVALGVGLVIRGEMLKAEALANAKETLQSVESELLDYEQSGIADVSFERELRDRADRMSRSYQSRAEWLQLGHDERELLERLDSREDKLADLLSRIDSVSGLPGIEREAADLRARTYRARWRAAKFGRDEVRARFFRAKVEENDPRRKYSKELQGQTSVTFDSDPPGAAVHVFRYEDHGSLTGSGEPRLVPVSVLGAKPQVEPGTWCLEVLEDNPPLQKSDLIFELAGRPIEGTVLVLADGGSVRRLDRVLSIDGEPIRSHPQFRYYQGWWLGRMGARTFELERDGEILEVIARSDAEFGSTTGSPADVAMRGQCPARVYRRGEIIEFVLPAGCHVLTTASPLLIGSDTSAGKTPDVELTLREGPHLAIFHHPDGGELRVPFDVEAGQEGEVYASFPDEPPLPGFVPIVVESDAVETPFWIQRREVTFAEYLDFLNDPDILDEIDNAGEPIYFPREPENIEAGGFLPRANGRYHLPYPAKGEHPVLGVNYHDAIAYAEWLTDRSLESDQPWVFTIPTLAEIDLVRGASRFRTFANGQAYRPRWYKSWFTLPMVIDARAQSYPIDEIPPGVFDIAGSVSEWTMDWYDEEFNLRQTYGGSWAQNHPDDFRLDYTHFVQSTRCASRFGFRLIARP